MKPAATEIPAGAHPKGVVALQRNIIHRLPAHPKAPRMTARLLRAVAAILDPESSTPNPIATDDAHTWRSPRLGQRQSVTLTDGDIEYYERGTGPTIIFLHGWLANANLWRNVVDELHESFRCITVALPLGSHRVPMSRTADLGPDGIAAIIASFLEQIDADDVTVVGNDSGGAYAQIAIARHTDRVDRLALTSSETPWDCWPPAQFSWLCSAARSPERFRDLANGMQSSEMRIAGYGPATGITKRLPPEELLRSYALPGYANEEIRANAAAVMSSSSSAALHSASRRLMSDTGLPILLIWSREDPVFPVQNARRFATELPDARIVEFDDAFSFTPEDRPDAVAAALREFVPVPR